MKALICLFLLLSFAGCDISCAQAISRDGWLSLFDGKTVAGWRTAQRDTLPDKGWYVKNRKLIFDPARGHGSDIITTRSFKDFDLFIQFKITKGGNSGIKYFLLPNTSLGCEYQVIDDTRHSDAKSGIDGTRKTGALYDIIPARRNKRYRPAGKWNKARIRVQGNHAEHWLNGAKTLDYERGSEAFKEAISKSKFNKTQGFAEAASSPVLLQAHGDNVSYRRIKIREL